MPSISKILIANRGEIAVRIIRAARDLGIHTVQAYSSADEDSLPVKIADQAIHIGEAPATQSYLNIEAILTAAKKTGADAIHPGYGFLAENALFAEKVVEEGKIFVGPSGHTIRLMGDKMAARKTALEVGVPTVPGSDGMIDDLDKAQEQAKLIGFPIVIKAASGGGGRGIRIARTVDEFTQLVPQAAAEAEISFGDGSLYFEKMLIDARHIEVQILGDGHDMIHLFERECSLQRRRQKIWEEAPFELLPADIRIRMCDYSVLLAEAVEYRGAGTVEFLYDEITKEFYFIEMNTRIQVEHPVTEQVTGIDLVAEMIKIAGGAPLSLKQSDVAMRGHSIEVRINAEDPANGFMPSPGTVNDLLLPDGLGIRFDHMLYRGYQIPPYYDSLLGKLIVSGTTREQTIKRLRRALGELKIEGVKTTTPLLIALSEDPSVLLGNFHSRWLESWLKNNLEKMS